jgi:hypothetical protein
MTEKRETYDPSATVSNGESAGRGNEAITKLLAEPLASISIRFSGLTHSGERSIPRLVKTPN